MKRAHALAAAASLGMLLVSACSATEGQTAKGDPRGTRASSPAARVGDSGAGAKGFTHALPVAEYEYSTAQERLIAQAQDSLTRDCMQRFGLGYHPADVDISENPAPSDRRYGISDLSEAEKYGYHLAPSPRTVSVSSADPSYPVLYGAVSTFHGKGVPKGGCRAEGLRKWEAERPATEAADVAREIAVNSFRKSLSDSSVLKVTEQWTSCMKSEGFSYSSPLAPPRDFDLESTAASGRERKVAVADVTCKGRTNLLKVWFDAESRIQRADIKANTGRLSQLSVEHGRVEEFARSTAAASKASGTSRSHGG
ncbi:hypothetical protein [Streptomyces sp. NPDC002516]